MRVHTLENDTGGTSIVKYKQFCHHMLHVSVHEHADEAPTDT
jgi:hypothetical protein